MPKSVATQPQIVTDNSLSALATSLAQPAHHREMRREHVERGLEFAVFVGLEEFWPVNHTATLTTASAALQIACMAVSPSHLLIDLHAANSSFGSNERNEAVQPSL